MKLNYHYFNLLTVEIATIAALILCYELLQYHL